MVNTITTNGLTLGNGTDYIIHRMTGFGLPLIRTSSDPRSGADGRITWNQLYDGRRLILEGHINLDDYGDIRDARNALYSAFTIKNGETPMTINTTDGETYVIDYKTTNIDQGTAVAGQITHLDFRIEVTSDDHRFFANSITSTNIDPPVGGGTGFPATFPVVFSSGSGGSATITNNGSAMAEIDVYFYGEITNPRLTNSTTGESFQLVQSISSGSYVRIYNENNNFYVLQGGVTNRYSNFTGDFWRLVPGSNSITFNCSSFDGGYVLIKFRDSYLSI